MLWTLADCGYWNHGKQNHGYGELLYFVFCKDDPHTKRLYMYFAGSRWLQRYVQYIDWPTS